MSVFDRIRLAASKDLKRIVLPESYDPRTLEAVDFILRQKIAKIALIGKDDVRRNLKSSSLRDLEIINPQTRKDIDSFAGEYYELRKHKGMTREDAREAVIGDYVTFGALMVRRGEADGFVAGASHTTPDVLRTALRCIPIDRTVGIVSGAFLIEVAGSPYGERGVFVFADCAVNPEPDSRQLAGIAASSASLFHQIFGKVPRVAFLSYSSKGSAKGGLVDKVVSALDSAREIMPGILIDGEFQVDCAIVPEVAKIKCPTGDVGGKANVLIFPNLDSGNISYKLVQRLANARAVGPILLGFAKMASDLSRGSSVEDIVDAVAVTAMRAQNVKTGFANVDIGNKLR